MPEDWLERHRALNRASGRARRLAVDGLIKEHRDEFEAWYRFECLTEGVRPVTTVDWVTAMSDEEIRAWGEGRIRSRIAELRGLLRATVQDEVAGLEELLHGPEGRRDGGSGPVAD